MLLNPEIEPRSQLSFAVNAINDGGLFGVGIGEGVIKWRLPDAHTDFIIAVAAEEFGAILCVLIILFFCLITIRSLILLKNQKDFFIKNCGVGAISFFSLQAIINLGVSVRLLPAKGMTLPFISYGGSSLIASGFLMGLLLACTRKGKLILFKNNPNFQSILLKIQSLLLLVELVDICILQNL